MHTSRATVLCASLFALAIAGCDSSNKAKEPTPAPAAQPEKPLSVSDSATIVITATVTAIDYSTRRVTLATASGYNVEFIAGPSVQRLNEVRVGDSVKVEYTVTLLAELRAPTAQEAATPYSTAVVAGRAGSGNSPAAGAAQATTVVTTVVAIDQPNMRVTLRGPLGDTTTVRARNPENIKKLHVGDTIVITYTEAIGVSLVKVSGN
jgi:hypothetical protein